MAAFSFLKEVKMLFGTYQEVPYDTNKKACSISEVPRQFNTELNMSPIWAFPLNSMADAFIHSSFTAPNIPQLFYIFETDKYIRVNKIKHYQNIKNKIRTISDCIDNTVDNKHSEFLVAPEVMEKGIKRVFAPMGITNFLQGRDISCVTIQDFKMEIGAQEYLRDICLNMRGPAEELLNTKWNLELKNDFRRYNEYNRLIFESVFLPMAYYLATEGNFPFLYARSCNINHLAILEVRNKFAEWSYSACSKENYDKLYEKMEHLIVKNPELLRLIAENKAPGRNDPCCCGSGLKFKKCCGKYL